MVTEKSITDKARNVLEGNIRFRFKGGRNDKKEVRVTRETFFIGRSGNNNLVLDDRSVSRKHAVLNLVDDKFILSDLNSFKGTRVNGEKISEAELRNGDQIKLGDVTIEFLNGDAPVAASGRRISFWPVFFVLLAGVVAMVVLTGGGEKRPVNADLLRDIEYNYAQGIRAFNVERDIDSARLYWRRVYELDPDGNTPQGRKARALLNNLPSNTGGQDNR